MSAQCPINFTAIGVFGQYNEAAKNLIAAYRFGTARAVAGAGERYARFVDGRSLVNADIKAKLIGAEQKLGHFVVGAVGRISDGADALVDGVAKRATTGVERFDSLTAWSHDSAMFNSLRKLNMPVAKASLGLAEKLAGLSRRLSARAAGQPEVVVEVAEAAEAVKSTVRKARTAVKATRRNARQHA